MKKTTKILTLACAAIAFTATGAALQPKVANAAGVEPGFEFGGGTVRLVDPTGIRFLFGISDTYANVTDYEIGTLVIPAETLGENTLNHNADTTDSVSVNYLEIKCTGNWATDSIENATAGKQYFTSALTDIPEADYATRLNARAYVKIGDTYYYSDIAERSLSEVASKALLDGYTYSVLYDYVDTGLAQKNATVTVEEATIDVGEEYQLTLSNNWNCVAIWSVANEDVAKIDKNGVVTGVSEGETTVTAKLGTKEYTATLKVGKEIVEIDPLDLELGVDSNNKQNTTLTLTGATFGLDESVTITSVTDITDGEKVLALTDGVVSGVDAGVYTWLVGNSDGYYQKVQVTIATLIISNDTELRLMTDILNASVIDSETFTYTYSSATTTHYYYHGYFIMDNDVDCGGVKSFVSPIGVRNSNANNGFMGTFDGRGHTISNIKFSRTNVSGRQEKTGLFGALGSEGVVKNVNFKGVNLATTYATVIGIASFGRVENVNIEVTSMAAGASGISMYAYTEWKDSSSGDHVGGAQLENVVIELNIASAVTLATDGGTFFCILVGSVDNCKGQFINNYYITNGKLATPTYKWGSNTTTAGKAIEERFDAAGNSNYLITGSATTLTETAYTKGSDSCEVNTGTTITTAIVMIDNVRVNATVANGVITLPTEVLDKLSAGTYTLTVLSGETYLECALSIAE